MEYTLLISVVVLACILYFIIGFGVSRMISDIKGRSPNLFEIIFWWVCCGVYAASGDIA
jgi:NhaP-type Na+/H+ or K+/H+ antiporter